MNKEQAFEEYEKTLDMIDRASMAARENAKETLHKQLKAFRNEAHEELRVIRAVSQKIK